MYRKQVNEHSPIRILESSIHGGLGAGNLGLVMARAGVGKTACLVQIGLDDLMRERSVLHVAIDQTLDHVRSWYDTLFDDLVRRSQLEDADAIRDMIARHRVIATFTDHDVWPERLQETVRTYEDAMDFHPKAILVDGFPWSAHSQAKNAAIIGAFKSYAKLLGAELWMSALTHRRETGRHPGGLGMMAPWNEYAELIDVALFLEPKGGDVVLRLLKDHDEPEPSQTVLHLHPDTLHLVSDAEERTPSPKLPCSAHVLLSGGAQGAEAEFGACAEAWGMTEFNFSFKGRNPARKRGLVQLTDDELADGAVSPMYIEAQLHRRFPDAPQLTKVLQSIWHQVNTSGEVFAVGWVLEDGTVKGGTGWAAELARHWHKPVFVFDQDKNAWLAWSSESHAWKPCDPPRITHRRFTGAGTRHLTDAGRAAILELFERSFGKLAS